VLVESLGSSCMLRAMERSPFAAINADTFFTMLSKLEVSSVALAKINETNLPEGFASGCLMDYHGHRLLLTVAHAAHEGPPLALALGWDPALRRVKLWRFGGS
jgi:hypothetical protein